MKINEQKRKSYLWGEAEWKKRTEFIAKLIPKGSSVIDLGGGLGHLFKYLDDCHYVSLDVDTFTDATIKADFNKGEYPDIKPKYQYVVAQGIIEYMNKPKEFLRQIQKYGDILILTFRRYAPGKWRAPRKDFTFIDIFEWLKVTGWEKLCEKNLLSDADGPIEKVIICRLRKKHGGK